MTVSLDMVLDIWHEHNDTVFGGDDALPEPHRIRLRKSFPDNRVGNFQATFYQKNEEEIYTQCVYDFLREAPSERALKEVILHEMVHHADAILHGPATSLKHGKFFFSWRDRAKEYGYHLGRKVLWE